MLLASSVAPFSRPSSSLPPPFLPYLMSVFKSFVLTARNQPHVVHGGREGDSSTSVAPSEQNVEDCLFKQASEIKLVGMKDGS